MAKRQTEALSASTLEAAEHKIEDFAEDLGRLLGNAQSKAEGWLGQRKAIADYLTGIRDTATGLLGQLGVGDGAASAPGSPRRGRPRRVAAAGADAPDATPVVKTDGRKRTMSPEARARIGEAQRKRWAKLKRSQGK